MPPSLPSLPIGPGDVEWLVDHLDDWLFRWSWRKALEAQARAKMDPRTYEFLASMYGNHPLLTVDGTLFPAVVIRAPESQWDRLESVLARPLAAEARDYDDLAEKGTKHLERLERLSKIVIREENGREHRLLRLYEGRGYRMLAVRTHGLLQLECCPGWYYDQIRTCDCLQ